jgi:hypothetical protein
VYALVKPDEKLAVLVALVDATAIAKKIRKNTHIGT